MIRNSTKVAAINGLHLGFELVENGMTDITIRPRNTTNAETILKIKNKLIFEATSMIPVEATGAIKTSMISDSASKNSPTGINKRNPQKTKNQIEGDAVFVCIIIRMIKTIITINPQKAAKYKDASAGTVASVSATKTTVLPTLSFSFIARRTFIKYIELNTPPIAGIK